MATSPFQAIVEQHYLTLRRLAARALRDRSHLERMSPTSLVAECMVRMMAQRDKPLSESHLRGLATVFMARILSDSARSRLRAKRGRGKTPRAMGLDEWDVPDMGSVTGAPAAVKSEAAEMREALLDAMQLLADTMPRQMEVVTLHMVAGIPLARVAELVGVSERTAHRDLEAGKAALQQGLGEAPCSDRSRG